MCAGGFREFMPTSLSHLNVCRAEDESGSGGLSAAAAAIEHARISPLSPCLVLSTVDGSLAPPCSSSCHLRKKKLLLVSLLSAPLFLGLLCRAFPGGPAPAPKIDVPLALYVYVVAAVLRVGRLYYSPQSSSRSLAFNFTRLGS